MIMEELYNNNQRILAEMAHHTPPRLQLVYSTLTVYNTRISASPLQTQLLYNLGSDIKQALAEKAGGSTSL